MHGIGNDYIIIDNRENDLKNEEISIFAQKVCQRRDYVQEHMKKMIRIYEERTDILIECLLEKDYRCEKAKGTFYIWLNCGKDSRRFVSKLLEKGVVVTPGIGFGNMVKSSYNFR